MKSKHLSLAFLVLLLGGCIPAYTIEPYSGSLNRCADIQGTYPAGFRNAITAPQATEQLQKAIREKKYALFGPPRPAPIFKPDPYKAWVSYKFLDDQRLEIVSFNEIGQSVTSIVHMQKEAGKLTCNSRFWERSYDDSWMGEGSHQIIAYYKVTPINEKRVQAEMQEQQWAGYLGLNFVKQGDKGLCVYYQKIDLTLQDILAGNEKAKRAIENYEKDANPPKCSP